MNNLKEVKIFQLEDKNWFTNATDTIPIFIDKGNFYIDIERCNNRYGISGDIFSLLDFMLCWKDFIGVLPEEFNNNTSIDMDCMNGIFVIDGMYYVRTAYEYVATYTLNNSIKFLINNRNNRTRDYVFTKEVYPYQIKQE